MFCSAYVVYLAFLDTPGRGGSGTSCRGVMPQNTHTLCVHPWQRRFRELLQGSAAQNTQIVCSPLAEEVQGPPAGECCPRIQKICILELYSGGPEYKFFGFQKCLLIFGCPQKPNYMLQILGKNTEAKFYCRKKGPEAKKNGEVKFFGFWKIWVPWISCL